MLDHTTKTNTQALRRIAFASSALALALTAGSAVAAWEPPRETQPKESEQPRDAQGDRENQPRRNIDDGERNRNYQFQQTHQDQILHFARANTLLDSSIHNNLGEELGELKDFVIDRGSGRIVFAIIESDAFWGMGGDEFAVKYDDLRYMAPGQSYVLDVREESIEDFAEALPDDWDKMSSTGWMDGIKGWFTDEDQAESTEWDDRVHDAAASPDRNRKDIEGRIVDIGRDVYGAEEHIVLTIRDHAGTEQEVVLAPSWHAGDLEAAMNEDAQVKIKAVQYGNRWVAKEASFGDRAHTFRDDAGKATWSDDRTFGGRYVLLSQLENSDVGLVGSTFGDVESVVIEAPSGYVAFLGIDPNTNLLGIGDEVSLVPWSAFSINQGGEITLRGSEEQFARSMTIPEDLSKLTSPTAVAQAYNAYDENMPTFKPRDKERSHSPYSRETQRDLGTSEGMSEGARAERDSTLWSRDAEMMNALREGESTEVTGTYRGSRQISLAEGASPAHMIVIDTPDGRKNIIVGPVWFVEREGLDLKNGDEVTVVGKSADFNGRTLVAAWSVEREDDTWKFWEGQNARWK